MIPTLTSEFQKIFQESLGIEVIQLESKAQFKIEYDQYFTGRRKILNLMFLFQSFYYLYEFYKIFSNELYNKDYLAACLIELALVTSIMILSITNIFR